MSPLGKRAWTILQLLGEVFLYALWRDVVWGLHSKSLCKWVPILFLYALWRDVVWDPGGFVDPEGLYDTKFLYALWRDVVWDSG